MTELMPDGGFFTLLLGATVPVKVVLGLLAAMSLWSWAIIFAKFMLLSSTKRRVVEGYERFLLTPDLSAGLRELGDKSQSPLMRLSTKAVGEFNQLKQAEIELERKHALVKDTLRRMLKQGISAEMRHLASHISFLATCSNAAPFIGLFGTVWGIMDAFHKIGFMKSAALTTVAPGISEALIATAFGLAVAIPAVLAYNSFRSTLSEIQDEMINFAGAFLNRVEREIPAGKLQN